MCLLLSILTLITAILLKSLPTVLYSVRIGWYTEHFTKDDGRVLKGVVRKDAYTIEWGDRSRLEMVVGKELRDRHNSPKSRLRLEIVGEPNCSDYEDQSRLELWYDETGNTFRASQPVTVSDETRDTLLADETAVIRNLQFLIAHQT